MSAEIPAEALHLRSLVRADQTLELFLDMVPVSEPGPDEVLIRVEAAPLNPSDMGLLFGGADMAAAVASGSAERPVVTAPIPDAAMRGLAVDFDDKLVAAAKDRESVRKRIEVISSGVAIVAALADKVLPEIGGFMKARMPEHDALIKEMYAKVNELHLLIDQLSSVKRDLPAE